jgi:tetratricopeptide (TPR) repeat protein
VTKLAVPPSLLNAVREQRAILFLGAGASIGAKSATGEGIPIGDKLRDKLCDKFLGGELKDKPLVAVAAITAEEVGLIQMQKYISDTFSVYYPAGFHTLIPIFRWRIIASTNYDLIVERAYEQCDKSLQRYVKSVKNGDQFDERMNATSDPVGYLKLHGCIEYYTDIEIPLILGQEQYASYSSKRDRLYMRLRDLAYECPLVFCGYSISDPHIQRLIFDMTDKSISRPRYYAVLPGVSQLETRYWASNNIMCLDTTFEDFLKELDRQIPPLARQLRRTTSGERLSLQNHYRVLDPIESELLRFYIENDVTHLHSAMVTSQQDPLEFYKGYDTGFGSILQNLDITRHITDSILVDAVLADEANCRATEVFLIKGPAGNGKTVTLKRVAWEAGVRYEKISLYTNKPSGLRIEPLKEIFALTGKRIYLFVDRVSLVRDELSDLLKNNRVEGIPLTIVCAERENEWLVYCESLVPFLTQEFTVDYLVRDEIVSLIASLERHHALGFLTNRSPADRISAFAVGADRQLLVALHEATLGRPFERIVLDEYDGIPDTAKSLYLDICALHQFGTPVRAGLISRVSGITFSQFGEKFLAPLREVVIVEKDESNVRDVYYRSRHQHVAQLVFHQVLESEEEKYALLSKLIMAMNIDYTADRETFGRVIRGREVAQLFANVELGRLLYEDAMSAAKDEAFVYHQLAVFELRHASGSLERAEQAASEAARLSPHARSIRHTQAEIARRQANTTPDALRKQAYRRVARKRLEGDSAQLSEYDLTTKARLALDELREVAAAAEPDSNRLLAVTKEAETSFQRARTKFPDSSQILAAEAELLDLLDKAPKALAALEKAFRLNQSLDWLAIRLARRYSRVGNDAKAIEVLEQCLRTGTQSKDVHLTLANILRQINGEQGRIIENLRKGFVPGDTNFEAQFLYGRELFLAKSTNDAKEVFARLDERAPGRFRTAASEIATLPNGRYADFNGSVSRKEEGYGFIRLIDFGIDVFASRVDTARSNWEQLRAGSHITCHIAFNRKGPRAINLTLRQI